MTNSREVDLCEVIEFLLEYMDEEEAINALLTIAPHFGDMNAIEFAKLTSWNDVLGVLKRVFE